MRQWEFPVAASAADSDGISHDSSTMDCRAMDRRILVVDSSESTRETLTKRLTKPTWVVEAAEDATEALECLLDSNYSLVLIDLRLPGLSGLEFLVEIRKRDIPVTVIVTAASASVDAVVEAMRLGAYDFVEKPFDLERLDLLVENALAERSLQDEVQSLRTGRSERFAFDKLLGRSLRMREVFGRVARVASSNCSVLVTGETGTGKELVAQAIHYNDRTRRGPLVAVNCAAIPESLLESEFFGHEKGAFTSAERRRTGRFEQASGGTLLLDEVGSLPMAMQAKLLRVLQDGTFERVGGSETIRSEARILATTNESLGLAVAEGRFREDLYYRLNVVTIELPPLRDRIEDLPLLIEHFLERLQARGFPPRKLAPETLARLARHAWPGNVRELEHVIEQMAITSPEESILPTAIPPQIIVESLEDRFSLDFDEDLHLPDITEALTERVERAYLQQVLEKYRGRIDPAARHCGLSRRTISEKLKRYGIDKAEFKPRVTRKRENGRAQKMAIG